MLTVQHINYSDSKLEAGKSNEDFVRISVPPTEVRNRTTIQTIQTLRLFKSKFNSESFSSSENKPKFKVFKPATSCFHGSVVSSADLRSSHPTPIVATTVYTPSPLILTNNEKKPRVEITHSADVTTKYAVNPLPFTLVTSINEIVFLKKEPKSVVFYF